MIRKKKLSALLSYELSLTATAERDTGKCFPRNANRVSGYRAAKGAILESV